jgi:hypothetical protein
MTRSGTYEWLETLLNLLFDQFGEEEARDMLRDESARRAVLASITPQLISAGADPAVLGDSLGRNLFSAVLTLRMKFSRDDALAKVRARDVPDRILMRPVGDEPVSVCSGESNGNGVARCAIRRERPRLPLTSFGWLAKHSQRRGPVCDSLIRVCHT